MATSGLTTKATDALLALDEEADALIDVEVSVSGWSLGFYRRECVTMVADVVRTTRVILLPMPGGHPEHGASCTGGDR